MQDSEEISLMLAFHVINYCCIATYIYKYMRNVIKHNDDSNKQTNSLFYKNIISHTLFLKGWCWLCVRDELVTETDCYIDPKFFFDHSSTSFSSWLGCSTMGHWGPKALCLPLALTLASFLQLTQTAPDTWLYYYLTPTCFCCSSAYLHRCIFWLTTQSRVNI